MDIDITTQFKTEGQPAFPVENKENANSADSSSGEKTNVDQTQSQEGDQNSGAGKKDDNADMGFADHPRWKERETDWTNRFNEQEKRHVDELAKFRSEMEAKFAEAGGAKNSNTNADGKLPDRPIWFGGDDEQWAEFQKWNESLLTQAEERAMKRITSQQESDQKRVDEATKYMNDEVATIEADKTLNPEGAKIDRNKLLKTALDFKLVDTEGKWNYRAAWMILKNQKTSTKAAETTERKNLAGDLTSENRSENKPPAVTSSTDFSKPGARPW